MCLELTLLCSEQANIDSETNADAWDYSRVSGLWTNAPAKQAWPDLKRIPGVENSEDKVDCIPWQLRQALLGLNGKTNSLGKQEPERVFWARDVSRLEITHPPPLQILSIKAKLIPWETNIIFATLYSCFLFVCLKIYL